MVGHLKNVSPTFAQMPHRITNVEFTTVGPTIANTMLNKAYGSFSSISLIAFIGINFEKSFNMTKKIS
jgi:hypothetical protein